jgi:hypothetical protein
MVRSGLGDVLDGVAPAGAELAGTELAGAVSDGWALLERGALERLGELLAVGWTPPPAGDEVAGGGGWLVTGGAELAGTELDGVELAGAELGGAELLVAGELGGTVTVGVEVCAGVLDVRVELGDGVTGTLGVGRLVLDGKGLPVLAQLSRMLSEVTTVPSRAITRTWYLVGLGTTGWSVIIAALGSSKLTRVPSGSFPASRPSWRTSRTV